MTKFNDFRNYRGDRIYLSVPNAPRISRLWVWNSERNEYQAPIRGNAYMAKRYQVGAQGQRKRVVRYFKSLEEARDWQAGGGLPGVGLGFAQANIPPSCDGPLFGEIVDEWKRRKAAGLRESTRLVYERTLNHHLRGFMPLGVREITPAKIDLWLDEMKARDDASIRSGKRASYGHELTLLATILRYYQEYHDDECFQFPVKGRHREASQLESTPRYKPKDLTEEEFLSFRERLLGGPHGEVMGALATVQYYQALRVSEVAGLYWEDVLLDLQAPQRSRLRIVRTVFWPRRKGLKSEVRLGFKNARVNAGVKEQPVFPSAFAALLSLFQESAKGLVFSCEGKHLEYRQIQFAYDRAFKAAGLPYTGTHVMRHGGTRNLYNRVPDATVAQQLLGNSSLQSTLIYARRHKAALTKVAEEEWARADLSGCKRLQKVGGE